MASKDAEKQLTGNKTSPKRNKALAKRPLTDASLSKKINNNAKTAVDDQNTISD